MLFRHFQLYSYGGCGDRAVSSQCPQLGGDWAPVLRSHSFLTCPYAYLKGGGLCQVGQSWASEEAALGGPQAPSLP